MKKPKNFVHKYKTLSLTLIRVQRLILAGTTVENKGKLILTEIFPSVQKRDIFLVLIYKD